MNCLNETITIQCLREICFGKSVTECSGVGGSVAAGVIVTGLIAAAVSVIIHLALHIWFYKPRMEQGRNASAKKKFDETHDYETIYDEGKKTVAGTKHEVGEKEEMKTELSKNVAYFTRPKKNKN